MRQPMYRAKSRATERGLLTAFSTATAVSTYITTQGKFDIGGILIGSLAGGLTYFAGQTASLIPNATQYVLPLCDRTIDKLRTSFWRVTALASTAAGAYVAVALPGANSGAISPEKTGTEMAVVVATNKPAAPARHFIASQP